MSGRLVREIGQGDWLVWERPVCVESIVFLTKNQNPIVKNMCLVGALVFTATMLFSTRFDFNSI